MHNETMNPDEQQLDLVLQRVLPPPPLPDHFRHQLMMALQQDTLADLARRRATLEAEHERLLQQVRRGYIRVRRDTLALGAGLAFASGALVTVGLPWLQVQTGLDAAMLMHTLALAMGIVTTLGVWWLRLRSPTG